jgi:hypothetical protein
MGFLLGLVSFATGCTIGDARPPVSDASSSGGVDAQSVAAVDAAIATGVDATAIASPDAGANPGHDAGGTAGRDAGAGPDGGGSASADAGGVTGPELWFYAPFNLQVDSNVDTVKALIDRAAAAGYHGMVLADFKINLLQTGVLASWYATNLADVLAHADSKGIEVMPEIFPFGYSEGITYQDPNLAEGLPVVGAKFTVASGGTLQLVSSFQGPTNGGFESHTGDTFDGWSWQDAAGTRTIADTAVAHSGSVSARLDPGSGNARIVQALTLTPHRLYHVRFWLKTDSLSGGTVQLEILEAGNGHALNYNELKSSATQDWTAVDFTFNSMSAGAVNLYLGVWDGFSAGHVWFDDVTIEETAMVNLIRRPGAPLVAKDGSGTALVEGTDFAAIADPAIASNTFDDWHTPPTVNVPAGSRLKTGDAVTIDHYTVVPVNGGQVGACLTEPAIDQWMSDNMTAVAKSFPSVSGFFLGYDEMRQMNSCASCAAKSMTAGGLLAWHAARAIGVVQAAHPGAKIWVWSDMFDPNHNAHDDYYLVFGDLSGSWNGLTSDVRIMNWHLGSADSLKFFADRGNEQVIAGYYDSGDGAGSAATELAAAKGLSGIRGMMYTTWQQDFSQLESYADGARANW